MQINFSTDIIASSTKKSTILEEFFTSNDSYRCENPRESFNQKSYISCFGESCGKILYYLSCTDWKGVSGFIRDGKRYIYNTQKAFSEFFSMCSRTFQRATKKLKEMGMICCSKLRPHTRCQTLGYSVDIKKVHEKLKEFYRENYGVSFEDSSPDKRKKEERKGFLGKLLKTPFAKYFFDDSTAVNTPVNNPVNNSVAETQGVAMGVAMYIRNNKSNRFNNKVFSKKEDASYKEALISLKNVRSEIINILPDAYKTDERMVNLYLKKYEMVYKRNFWMLKRELENLAHNKTLAV